MNQPRGPVAGRDRLILKMVGLVVLGAISALLYWQYGSYIKLDWLAQQESRLRDLQRASPVLVVGSAFLIYITVTGLSLPGAAGMSLVIGWYFGFWRGLLFISFASTTGAAIAFLLSRYFFREIVQRRFGARLKSFDQALEREGAFYLLTLRLIPAIPFFVINAVMGLTKIRLRTYWWVSQLGMLPGTAVYVYAGSRVPDLRTLSEQGIKAVFTPSQLGQLTLALLLLATFPLLMKWFLKRLGLASRQPDCGTKGPVEPRE